MDVGDCPLADSRGVEIGCVSIAVVGPPTPGANAPYACRTGRLFGFTHRARKINGISNDGTADMVLDPLGRSMRTKNGFDFLARRAGCKLVIAR
jgi:hypothetical protein